ncbi:tetratricopeptide repeat protein [Hymenobacter caeli]|uniref:ABC-type branched-subunit amino acid transport system substrate-binding protein n=1 Tax=Hymenobacter caeli TaxID=2735894 RepID=A0ABX2FTR8_9BACT|nr:tetratricopeptide repeat protein [Hymenobacter caeli]NRT19790.1 ABC-type branched-subunit amino acid transport system substrate-binding protein [Hymenobacter caeli]
MPFASTRRFRLFCLLLGALPPLAAAAQAPAAGPPAKAGAAKPAAKAAAKPDVAKPVGKAGAKPTPPDARYRAGKALLDQGQYAAALAALEPLAQPAARFAHAADAAYLAAVANARLRQWADAEQLLNLLRAEYPAYPALPEALLLQGQVSLEQGDYDTALKTLGAIPAGKLDAERDALKAAYLPRLNERATWQRLLRRSPDDAALARAYADRLAAPIGFGTEADRPQLDALIDKFHLDRARYAGALAPRPVAHAAAHKTSYNVAVLLPFELDDPSWQKLRKNQFVTDLYAGLRLAQDSLQRAGHPVQLFAYDTGADTLKLKQVLALPELAGMDLLIGPVYKAGARLLGRYAQEHQIVCVNPLSQDGDLVLDNPWHFLNSPSAATQGRLAAQFAAAAFGIGRPAVLLHEDARDETAFADTYQATFEALGGKISARRRFNPDADESLAAASTGLDLAGAGHLVVASDSRKAGPYFLGVQRSAPAAARPPLLASGAWLDNPRLDPGQLNGPGTYFVQPKFIDEGAPGYRRFRQLYLQHQHLPPSPYAGQGYDLLLFFGAALAQFGPAFQPPLATEGAAPGAVFQGYDYPNGFRDNQVVPITRLDGLDVRVVK